MIMTLAVQFVTIYLRMCMQATFYSSIYPNCASPGSSSQYALPDFSSLTPDASTPARCVDALNYQVRFLDPCLILFITSRTMQQKHDMLQQHVWYTA